MVRSVRIGNCSGFYGDRSTAMTEMLEGGPLDVLTGDYLAELTMLILARQKKKDSTSGYARTYLQQVTDNLALALQKRVRLVSNAGGMNPEALAQAIAAMAADQDLDVKVAWVDGDDITGRADELGLGTPLAANAYLGGFGIKQALAADADVVVTGRVTDASIIAGSAAWFHDWSRDDWDSLAGATAAGHVIECGIQATGGNFSFFTEIENMTHPGFPIAEIAADGTTVITKHPGTDGAVTTETVLSQILYEIQGARYAGPDVTLRLDSIELSPDGEDRVRIHGVRGEAPPPDLKVSVNEIGGYYNSVTYLLTGLDIPEKAALAKKQFHNALRVSPASLEWTLERTDQPDSAVHATAAARLTVAARDTDRAQVGRAFSNAAVETGLSNYPGMFKTSPPTDAQVVGRFRAEYVPQDAVPHRVHHWDGTVEEIAPPAITRPLAPSEWDSHSPASAASPTSVDHTSDRAESHTATTRLPLGRLVGARSGDKGGNANIGVWARTEATWEWLSDFLTADRLRLLLPETRGLDIDVLDLPHLRARNFVIHGMLGEGVASKHRFDPQAKAIAEWLRSREVDVPDQLIH